MESVRFHCKENSPEEKLSPSMAGLMLSEAIRNLKLNEESLSEEGLSILTGLNELDNIRTEAINGGGDDIHERLIADLHFLEANAEKIGELHKKAKELTNKG